MCHIPTNVTCPVWEAINIHAEMPPKPGAGMMSLKALFGAAPAAKAAPEPAPSDDSGCASMDVSETAKALPTTKRPAQLPLEQPVSKRSATGAASQSPGELSTPGPRTEAVAKRASEPQASSQGSADASAVAAAIDASTADGVSAPSDPVEFEESKGSDDSEEDLPLKGRKIASRQPAAIKPSKPVVSAPRGQVERQTPVPLAPGSALLGKRSPAAQATAEVAQAAAAVAVSGVGVEKQLSYGFLRNKKDANGRSPGDPGYDKSTLLIKLRGDERFTPGQQQYWDIKKHHNDVIIFFKVGKFYELFEEDALTGHRELDLAFMGKGPPHVGFPEAVIGKYAEKLVTLGYKVGVVEQMETPKELEERNATAAKGKKEKTVKRQLCTVLTKGVAFHRDDAATYLLSVCEDEASGLLGVCFVDAASGKFGIGQCHEDPQKNRLHTLLAQLRPSEIIVDESRISLDAYRLLRRSVPEGLFNTLPRGSFWDVATAKHEMREAKYFGEADTEWPAALQEAAGLDSPVGMAAFGGCVCYLRRLLLDQQLLTLGAVEGWQPSDSPDGGSRTLILDSKALENLEVFENSSDRGTKGTLYSVLDHCASPFGKRKLRGWLCRPPAMVADIKERQDAVAALMSNRELCTQLQSGIKKLPDLERLLAQIHAFGITQASNKATHYEDIGRKRLNEFIRCLEGFESLAASNGCAARTPPFACRAVPTHLPIMAAVMQLTPHAQACTPRRTRVRTRVGQGGGLLA